MICPECGSVSGVVETRTIIGALKRRRRCVNGHRFTTYEIMASAIKGARRGVIAVPAETLAQLRALVCSIMPIADPGLTDSSPVTDNANSAPCRVDR